MRHLDFHWFFPLFFYFFPTLGLGPIHPPPPLQRWPSRQPRAPWSWIRPTVSRLHAWNIDSTCPPKPRHSWIVPEVRMQPGGGAEGEWTPKHLFLEVIEGSKSGGFFFRREEWKNSAWPTPWTYSNRHHAVIQKHLLGVAPCKDMNGMLPLLFFGNWKGLLAHSFPCSASSSSFRRRC